MSKFLRWNDFFFLLLSIPVVYYASLESAVLGFIAAFLLISDFHRDVSERIDRTSIGLCIEAIGKLSGKINENN